MALRCMLMRARTTALRPPPSSGQASSPAGLLAGALRSPAAVLMTPHTSPAAAGSRRHLSTLFRQIGEGYNPVAKRGLYVRDVLQRFGLTQKRNCSSSTYSAQYSKIRHDPYLELGLRRQGVIWEDIKTASLILGSWSVVAAAFFVVVKQPFDFDAKMKHRLDHAKTHIDAKKDEHGFRETIGVLYLLFILMLFLFVHMVDADDCKGRSIQKRKKPSLLHN